MCGEQNEEKEQGWRQGGGTNAHGRRGGSRFARGHNLQHLLAVIDQRKRREGNGVWSVTGWRTGLKSETPGKNGVCERIRGIGVEEDNTDRVKRRREVRRQTKQGTERERNRRGVGG